MGNAKSRIFQDDLTSEMSALSNTVNAIIISTGVNQIDGEHQVNPDALCERFTYVLDKNLYKYQKAHLEEYRDNIIIIPKRVSEKNKQLKTDICQTISKHFNRLLTLVHAIRNIMDMENDGQNSIAGICLRNINQIDDLVEVKYCESKQYHNNVFTKKHKTIQIARKLDMSQLSGFSILMDSILSRDEARVFKKLIGSLLQDKIMKLKVADKLIMKNFDNFDDNVHDMNSELRQKGGKVHGRAKDDNQYLFKVSENKPIFSIDTCYIQKKYILPKSKIIQNKLQKQEGDYLLMMKNVNELLNDMVLRDDDNNTLELRVLTHKQLDDIENRSKRLFMTFYLQSIVNYNSILKSAEKTQKFNSGV